MTNWPHTEIGLSFSADPKEDAEIKEALAKSYAAMMLDLNTSMYADAGNFTRPSSLAIRFMILANRIRDAWLVLRVRAEIY